MKAEEVKKIMERAPELRIGVLGDIALDVYWMLEDGVGELSVETGKRALAVRLQNCDLGGGGNIITNLAALETGSVSAFGVVGRDIFGRELVRLLENLGINAEGMITQHDKWDTPVWAKPHLNDEEMRRLDFGCFNELSDSTRRRLLESLERALPELDVLLVNQQLPRPLVAGGLIEELNGLAARFKEVLFLVDCRLAIRSYAGMAMKFNEITLAQEYRGLGQDDPVESVGREEIFSALESLFAGSAGPVIVTRGARGAVLYENGELQEIPGVFVAGPVDPVGAGDTMLAAVSVALAGGAPSREAVRIGSWAAAVTVSKLKQTGTATCREIVALSQDCGLVYCPELAEDSRHAEYLSGTRIEVVRDELPRGRIAHMIFDHDGTISTLRQGWEPIMEKMMMEYILGPCSETVSTDDYRKLQERVHLFIDQTTGIQTIVQMQGMVEMIQEFGYVPQDEILDAKGYKAIYNEMLLEIVDRRLARLEAGELDVEDFTVKGAVDFLKYVRQAGITCYLASGTDIGDVKKEAGALGYADLFNGGIYGSVGDINKFSKKILIAGIISEHGLQGPQLCCFGDGPVEIRETKKAGGLTVGVASDEMRRFGLNAGKRSRLIKAGADTVIGDFTQRDKVIEYLKLKV
jgi:sugar/nucleoside kinase (ribokinase family)/phosphoglycolate phosphatase-like HAD superfamily hydrolase